LTDLPLYRIGVARTPNTSTVTLSGELDLSSREDVYGHLLDEIAAPATRHLIIDMAAVGFLDSTAISILVTAYHHGREHGCRVTIARPSPQVTQILTLTGLLDLFHGNAPASE
jgi:anti-sigma B factor antagonist